MQTFQCRTEICYGPDALGRLEGLLCDRAMVVTDPFFMANGTAEKVGARLPCAAVTYFSDVEPDPELRLAARGLAMLQQTKPQVLVALGGGSALDCAKAMIWFYEEPVTFVAVPTTSGTGSEVTSFSILTHNGVKHPLIDPSLRPDIAILDDSLLQALPPSLVADAGMDVLAHCLEALASTKADPITNALAAESFGTAFELLTASFGGDRSTRGQIHLAATMAGLAFDHAGLGICHALAHALGGVFHKPHGRLNAVLLPEVVSYNASAAAAAYRRAALRCGFACATDLLTVRHLRTELAKLRRELKLPSTLAECGIDPAELKRAVPELARAALQDPCCATNPRKATEDELRQLLLAVAD